MGFGQYRPHEVAARLRLPAAVLAAIVLLGVAGLIAYRGFIGPRGWGTEPFDPSRWRAADVHDINNPRGRMVWSLLRQHQLIGMTHTQVRQLLGPPDYLYDEAGHYTSPVGEADSSRGWGYSLGPYSGFQIDDDVLCLRFGTEGRVVWCGVFQT